MSDGDLLLIPTDPSAPHPLGRSVVWHDPRNRQHRALVASTPLPDRSMSWYSTDVFDQQGPSCTMQSAAGVIRTSPYRLTTASRAVWSLFDTEQERHAGYLRAQTFDPWPGGEPHYEGSSTDAPFRMLFADGLIPGYKWLFGPHELKQWVMHNGPASVGTNWYVSMFRPDAKGYLRIVDSQGTAGGHAWRVIGWNVKRNAFRMVNSWSRAWGENGRAWVDFDTMARLLAESGEAVTIG